MPKVAKVGDQGHGFCKAGHPGYPKGKPKEITTEIITGSSDVYLNGQPMAIVGSQGSCSCGHHAEVTVGSSTVFVNGKGIVCVGDSGVITDDGGGDFDVITGSFDVTNDIH